ncbi:unnamed protein product [Closterium sp. NIES-53]
MLAVCEESHLILHVPGHHATRRNAGLNLHCFHLLSHLLSTFSFTPLLSPPLSSSPLLSPCCPQIQTAMPSAQNLVLMSQLSPATKPLAGMLASLMLRQYAISMLPITVWITVFLSRLNMTI